MKPPVYSIFLKGLVVGLLASGGFMPARGQMEREMQPRPSRLSDRPGTPDASGDGHGQSASDPEEFIPLSFKKKKKKRVAQPPAPIVASSAQDIPGSVGDVLFPPNLSSPGGDSAVGLSPALPVLYDMGAETEVGSQPPAPGPVEPAAQMTGQQAAASRSASPFRGGSQGRWVGSPPRWWEPCASPLRYGMTAAKVAHHRTTVIAQRPLRRPRRTDMPSSLGGSQMSSWRATMAAIPVPPALKSRLSAQRSHSQYDSYEDLSTLGDQVAELPLGNLHINSDEDLPTLEVQIAQPSVDDVHLSPAAQFPGQEVSVPSVPPLAAQLQAFISWHDANANQSLLNINAVLWDDGWRAPIPWSVLGLPQGVAHIGHLILMETLGGELSATVGQLSQVFSGGDDGMFLTTDLAFGSLLVRRHISSCLKNQFESTDGAFISAIKQVGVLGISIGGILMRDRKVLWARGAMMDRAHNGVLEWIVQLLNPEFSEERTRIALASAELQSGINGWISRMHTDVDRGFDRTITILAACYLALLEQLRFLNIPEPAVPVKSFQKHNDTDDDSASGGTSPGLRLSVPPGVSFGGFATSSF
jgi:hypothetical protein